MISSQAESPMEEELSRKYHYFVSKVSHEIRNPLTLIYSSLQLVEKKHPELTDTELWGQLRQEVQDTIALLNELSSYNNSDTLKLELLRPSVFLASLDTAFRPSMESMGIEFDTYTINKIPPIYADPLKLKEALTNLLRNAQDALSALPVTSDPVSKHIELYAEYTGHFVNFHVRDNGIGIPDEYIDTLFDPFVTHKANGTGLGLSIVKNIITNHDGSITLLTNDCPPNTYTDFCLSLPIDGK